MRGRARLRAAIAAVLLAAVSGCGGCDTVPDDAVTKCEAQVTPGVVSTDLLFVIDDSRSMAEEQDELARNLATFIDQLLASPIELDLRIGVTNASVEEYVTIGGTRTAYKSPGFPGPPGTPFPQGTLVAIEQDAAGEGLSGHYLWGTAYDDPAHLTSVWGGPRVLSSASGAAALARDFKANVMLGTWGASREQPLSAMRRALEKAAAGGPNVGFLRAGARLAVVILTDEDDCSGPWDVTHAGNDDVCHALPVDSAYLDTLADYVTYLDSTVGGTPENAPIVALIAGFDATGAVSICSGTAFGTNTAAAALPNRLNELLRLLDVANSSPRRTYKDSICKDFGPALLQIANVIVPQTMPLRQAPADWRMLAVAVRRASGAVVGCRLAEAGTADAPAADAVFAPPLAGSPASITFQNGCRLGVGDAVQLQIVCAR